MRNHKFRSYIFFFSLFFSFSAPALQAKLIEPEDLLHRVLNCYRYVYQYNLLTEVTVFDPIAYLPLEENQEKKIKPYELPAKGYKQNIIFVRDEFRAIEIQDFEKNILNIYFSQHSREQRHNFQPQRPFHSNDIRFPHGMFYTKHLSVLKERLNQYGISLNQVSLRERAYGYVYQLGSDDAYIIIDPDSFKVLELHTNIQYDGRYYPIRVVFSNWHMSPKGAPRIIPKKTLFYIKDRLYKEISVHRILLRGNYGRKQRFYNKYKSYLEKTPEFPSNLYFAY